MPPKKQPKPDKKKIAKAIEDKTFGLKNKSKSKNVQKYVQTVEQNVKSTSGALQSEQNKIKKKASKEAAKQAELEMKALFNEALLAGKKAPGIAAGKGQDPEPVAVEIKEKQIQETFEVVETERTIEDLIEEQRAKLMSEGKTGTPVTSESLAIWKARRLEMRLAEERILVEREMAKKGKKKGLAVLSGRALFDYDASLFRDDENAVGREETSQRDDYDEKYSELDALAENVDENLFLGEDDIGLDELSDESPD